MLWVSLVSLVAMGELDDLVRDPKHVAQAASTQNSNNYLDEPFEVDEVEVRGRRGAALVSPEIELSGIEIDALGAWDINEVLQRLTEMHGLGDGPMVIINGKRVPNSGSFTSFPPDALVRAEVLPAEAASLYGGAPGQRVVNLVLQRQFQSHDGRVTGGRPTQGGTSSIAAELKRSSIKDESTFQVGARASRDTALSSNEREMRKGDLLIGQSYTIRPSVDLAALNFSATRPIGGWSASLSLSGQAREIESRIRFEDQVFDSYRSNENLAATVGLSGVAYGWQLQGSVTGQAFRMSETGYTDAQNEALTLGVSGFAGKTMLELPAGPLVINLNSNLMKRRASVERGQIRTQNRLEATEISGTLAIPLLKASNHEGLRGSIGDLLGSLETAVRDSGAGAGSELSAGLTWTPRQKVRLNGLWTNSNESVPDNLRTEPLYYDEPRVLFDFRTGQSVEIVQIMGGNLALLQPRSERLSLTASVGPFTEWNLAANLGYQSDRTTNGIGSLPGVTEDIEQAFPERFLRDEEGRLVSIDFRPLNLGSSRAESLSTGLSFALPRVSGASAGEAVTLRVALNHSYRLQNTLSLAAGLQDLDRLKGDGGGVPKQDARILVDARRGPWGLNLSARWQDGYRTRQWSGVDGDSDLVVGDLASVDFTVSLQMMSRRQKNVGRRRGAGLQVSLQVSNLLDDRPSARLGNGAPAPGYGRDFQDPIGRTLRLMLQKRF